MDLIFTLNLLFLAIQFIIQCTRNGLKQMGDRGGTQALSVPLLLFLCYYFLKETTCYMYVVDDEKQNKTCAINESYIRSGGTLQIGSTCFFFLFSFKKKKEEEEEEEKSGTEKAGQA